MLHTQPAKKITSQPMLAVVVLCLSYLIFEILYIPHSALEVDEFWFGHHIYAFTKQLPYRDFQPYKTVLGYYLLAIPMFLSHIVLDSLYYIKQEIALINTFFLGITACWAMRFFQSRMILLSLLIIISSQLFLIYSADLRVDMLASWLGLVSLLFILSNRFFLAGLTLGISFLISQKALWFIIASDVALASYWFFATRSWQIIRATISFNFALCIPVIFYLIFWSVISNPSTVFHSVFYEPYVQSKITWYSQVYKVFWKTMLANGPLLVLLWPLTWLSLFSSENNQEKKRRIFIICYSSAMMLQIISYQQTFPYNMVFFVPPLFILFSDFFSWLNSLFAQKLSLTLNRRALFWFISLYSISIIGLIIALDLPNAYFLISLCPICFGIFIHFHHKLDETCVILTWLVICVCGIFFPLARFVVTAYTINNGYQEKMIIVANELLSEGGDYISGVPYIFDKDQHISGLKNLTSSAIAYIYKPSPQLLPTFIKSLYLEPRTDKQIIADLNIQPVKLFINSVRISALPTSIRYNLNTQFEHFWGSIFLYAPLVFQKQHSVQIKFSGVYLVTADPSAHILLDKKIITPNSQISLSAGSHISSANMDYRLKYIPNVKLTLDPEFQEDQWIRMLKPVMT